MTTVNFGFNQAVTGLMVNQAQIGVTSSNISNVNTAGYTVKQIQQTSLVLGSTGAGVSGAQITRRVDELLRADINRNTSVAGADDVRQQYLTRLDTLFGTPSGGSALSNVINDLSSKLKALALTPEDTSAQAAAVNSAVSVSSEVTYLANQVQSARADIMSQIDSAVTQVNNDLNSIRQLNAQIVRAGALGQSTADLEDQRDSALNDLSSYMDISTYKRGNGDVVVFTPGGKTLIDGQNSFSSLGNMALKSPGVPSTVVAGTVYRNGKGYGTAGGTTGGGVSGVLLGGMDASGVVQSGVDITNDFRSGKLAQLIELRDRTMPAMTQQLDNLSDMLRGVLTDDRTNNGAASMATGNNNSITNSGAIPPAATDNTITLYDANGVGQRQLVSPPAVPVTTAPPALLAQNSRLNTNGGDPFTVFTMGASSTTFGRASSFAVNSSLDPSQGGTPNLLYLSPEPAGLSGETLAQTLQRRLNTAIVTTNFVSGNLTTGNYTLNQFATQIASTTATMAKSAKDASTTQQLMIQNLKSRASETEGVNVDEEMAKLIQYQNAYSASARCISVADQMMQTLLEIGK